MKKTLLILLSLILCLSFTFTACNTEDIEFGDEETNGATEEVKDTRPAPSGKDKNIAQSSLNKIDLSTIMGSTEASFDIFKDIVAGLEVNIEGVVDGEEGKAWLKGAMDDGKIYAAMGSESKDFYEKEETFIKLDGTTADIFAELDGKWQLADTVNIEDTADIDMSEIEEIVKKVKIPELKAEYLTEKNGMLLVSNQYVLDVIEANIKLIAGEEISEEEEAEGLKHIEQMLKNIGLEIYVGTGYDKIVKLAVSATPSAEMAEEMEVKTIKAEFALDDDATYLKSASFSLELLGDENIDYTPKYNATLNSIVVDGKLTGFDLKANLSVFGASDHSMPDFDFDDEGNYVVDGEIVTEWEYTSSKFFNEVTIAAKVDLSKIETVGAEVASLKVEYKPVKAFEVTYVENLDSFDKTVKSVKEIENDEEAVTISGTIKTTAKNVASINGNFAMGENKLTINGSFSYGTVEFPEIPADIKSYFN
jgi:hypothetical protein